MALPMLASATGLLAATSPARAAAPGDGTVKVRVVREINANGTTITTITATAGSFDPKGRKVRCDDTWLPDQNTRPGARCAVGATCKCTARLNGVQAGKVHGDRSRADGEGEISGRQVKDEGPWHGIPPKFTIRRKDVRTGRPIVGAVFQLWRETNGRPGLQRDDTKAGAACATNDRGTCAYTTCPGRYYLQELAVPEGYALPARRVFGPYRVTEDTKNLVMTLYSKPSEPTKKK